MQPMSITSYINLIHQKNLPTSIQTFDIEGFYDNVDIEEMEKILGTLIPLAFKLANHKYLTVNPITNTTSWTNIKPKTYKNRNNYTFSEIDIINLQNWHLNNAHITYNKQIWRQIKGIGQGTNQSPDLADLILMYYEYQFVDYHTKHNPNIAKQFNYTTRKMDDILFINNPNAINHIYQDETNPHGIYPRKFFTLTHDKPPSTSADYLDMHIHISQTPKNLTKTNKITTLNLQQLRKLAKQHHVSSRDNKPILIEKILAKINSKNNQDIINKPNIWNSSTYNKTEKFPIPAINFPHYNSHTPHTIMTGSIIGRLHSYSITNAYLAKDFLSTARKLFEKLIHQNNYPINIIKAAINKFTNKHKTNYPLAPRQLNQLLTKCMGSI